MQRKSVTFHRVKGDIDKELILREVFKKVLTPLYGDQTGAIEKILNTTDRICRLAYADETPCGVVVFKTKLSNEFVEEGITESLEVKSLFLIDAANNSGKGYGQELIEYVLENAKAMEAKSIHLTVSENVPESLRFFQKHSFECVKVMNGKYLEGKNEFLLKCALGNTLKRKRDDLTMRPLTSDKRMRCSQTLHITLKPTYIHLIKGGQKRVEGRINTGVFKNISPGQQIRFYCRESEVNCEVVHVRRYSSFSDMLHGEGVRNILPNTSSVDAGVRLFHSFPGYAERSRRYGTIAIEIIVK